MFLPRAVTRLRAEFHLATLHFYRLSLSLIRLSPSTVATSLSLCLFCLTQLDSICLSISNHCFNISLTSLLLLLVLSCLLTFLQHSQSLCLSNRGVERKHSGHLGSQSQRPQVLATHRPCTPRGASGCEGVPGHHAHLLQSQVSAYRCRVESE